MAVRQLSAAGDYLLAFEAIKALQKIIGNSPLEVREILRSSIDDLALLSNSPENSSRWKRNRMRSSKSSSAPSTAVQKGTTENGKKDIPRIFSGSRLITNRFKFSGIIRLINSIDCIEISNYLENQIRRGNGKNNGEWGDIGWETHHKGHQNIG
jgi:hypothetical protein